MKSLFYYLLAIFTISTIVSCSKNDDDDLPVLGNEDDVCTSMDDSKFRKWCYEQYDVNGDGKVSKIEAAAVREFTPGEKISFNSIKGLEYFTGIERLEICGSFSEIELRHMPNLKSLSIVSSAKTYDVRNNPLLLNVTLKNYQMNSSLSNWAEVNGNYDIETILDNSCSQIIGIERLNNPKIVLYGIFYMDEIDLTNTNFKYTGVLITKKLTIANLDNDRFSSEGLDNDVKFKGDIYHRYKNLSVYWQTINSVNSENYILPSLCGTWKGNLYISSNYNGRTYDATYSEITFLRDPYIYSSGSGYWVDYYSNAPWDYVANHIDWTVRNNVIYIHFIETNDRLEIHNYHLSSNRFYGTIYESNHSVDFDLYNVSHPYTYWDDYRWGYDAWYDDYYWARTRGEDNDSTMLVEKPKISNK